MRRLVAMDLDGTLEDSRVDMVAAVNRVRATFDLAPRSHAQLAPHVNRGMAHLYAVCFDDHLAAGGDPQQLKLRYEADYGAHIDDNTELYEGMGEALAELASMATLAIVTNKPESLSHLLLAALGVRHRFEIVIGGDTCEEAKPTATPLLHAIASVGSHPDATVMIGDSPGDIACAKAAQTAVLWCAFGYKDAPGPHAPDAIAQHPEELPKLVAKLLARQ